MATTPRQFSEEEIEAVWQKASIQANNDPNVYRKDYAGAWIRRSDYGLQSEYGWEIDHVRPLAQDGSHNMSNLLPLQWRNNLEKSDHFPQWTTRMLSSGVHNIEGVKTWFVKPEDYA